MEIVLKSFEEFTSFTQNRLNLNGVFIQNVDFIKNKYLNWETLSLNETSFMGCELPLELEVDIRRKGAFIYTHPQGLSYNPYRSKLYTWQELHSPSQQTEQSYDLTIYNSFINSRFSPKIHEALCQRIHDSSIDTSLRELIGINEKGMTKRKCVAIMGGHGTLRTDHWYKKVAYTSYHLAKSGYFVVSGGGPGIMEAANLGAYFSNKSFNNLNDGINMISIAPHYSNKDYEAVAKKVIKKYPNGNNNLAIPTWFYGHEPSNLFASHIAKYFSNSIREDNLLSIALYGIIFAPGSAGTTQEIFQDATQNHYGTFKYLSPMVFLSKKRYEIDTLIFPLVRQLSYGNEYQDYLHLTDEPLDAVDWIINHPPKPQF